MLQFFWTKNIKYNTEITTPQHLSLHMLLPTYPPTLNHTLPREDNVEKQQMPNRHIHCLT